MSIEYDNIDLVEFEKRIEHGRVKFAERDCTRILRETKAKLENEKYLKIKDYPSQPKVIELLDSIEADVDLLFYFLNSMYYLGDFSYDDYINGVFREIYNFKTNNEDGYGYIWKPLNYYPTLINFYALSISLIGRKEFKRLKNFMLMKATSSYYDGNFMQKMNVSFIEKINCYHLFNFIDGLSVHLSEYFPTNNENRDYLKNTYINGRIYNFLKPKSEKFLIGAFQNYFDIFEYFLGIVFMDIRLSENSYIKFAPYGKNFKRYLHYDVESNMVSNFIEVHKENILEAGFFNGSKERLKASIKEYNELLIRIARGY